MMNFFRSSRLDSSTRDGTRNGHSGTPRSGDGEPYTRLKQRVQQRLLAELSPQIDTKNVEEVRRALERIFVEVLAEEKVPLSRAERADLFEQIVADVLGYGPIEPLLRDETVTEILVNGPDQVYIERNGVLEETDIRFRDVEELLRIIDRIVAPLGRRVDESSPMVDARLPDGSRVNIIIPPLSLVGPCISIRKFARTVYTVDDLIRLGTLTEEMAEFLRACVLARLNIVVSGGTSTGKTTLLNVLSSFLPSRERIITIEDAAELQLHQRHVVRLESRPPNVEGRGEVTIRQLVINALRMRPDRIIVGEVRGGEALDMLQAMNTGHDGSLTTAHSNSPRDTLRRIETMALMAGMDLPLRAVREQIASAFDLVVHLDRLIDGSRKVVQITEVQGMEGDVIVMQDLFRFVQTGVREGRVQGYFTGMGVRPKFMDKIEAAGIFLSPSIFAPVRR
ncbi:MAG TPA: CpaF family protein [Caldilineae bacterium]|nr:CpaF family protein [Caldilineae bacterium]